MDGSCGARLHVRSVTYGVCNGVIADFRSVDIARAYDFWSDVAFLLVEYNWKAQFGVANAAGQIVGVNWYAIAMMVFGFVILPLIMSWISRSERK